MIIIIIITLVVVAMIFLSFKHHHTNASTQAEKVERVSAKAEPSVTERFSVTTSKA